MDIFRQIYEILEQAKFDYERQQLIPLFQAA